MTAKDMFAELNQLSVKYHTSYSFQHWFDGCTRFTIGTYDADCDKYSIAIKYNKLCDDITIAFETEFISDAILDGDMSVINKFMNVITKYKKLICEEML